MTDLIRGIIQVEGRDEMRDELEKLRKYALLDSTHWEKLDYRARQRIAALSEPDGEQAPGYDADDGIPIAELEGIQGTVTVKRPPRPDYVPPDREDPHDMHNALRDYEKGYDPLCSTPLQSAVYALCRLVLAKHLEKPAPDRDGDDVLREWLDVHSNHGYAQPGDNALAELCRRELARGEGGR
jgi:hypothetical protein